MSTIRLPFLYPQLLRSAWRSEVSTQATRTAVRRNQSTAHRPTQHRSPRRCENAAAFSTAVAQRRSGFAPRRGKGVEPSAVQEEEAPVTAKEGDPSLEKSQTTDTTPMQAGQGESSASQESGTAKTEAKNETEPPALEAASTDEAAAPPPPAQAQTEAAPASSAAEQPQSPPADEQAAPKDGSQSGPMDAILHMGPPSEQTHKPPHLRPPPYVHHFDSYSLVKQLQGAGAAFTDAQAITAMKAVRLLLAQNLDVAQDGLVSKSDVENETYLFRAACSELSAEVRNRRRAADEHMRQQRTLLQHEADILAQTLTQDLRGLEDNTRGMFNDRKMAVREEQKANEGAIQQINYKISVELNSDAKSEVEALRWVLIRRSVLALVFVAVLTLGTLRYASYLGHERAREAERAAREAEALKRSGPNGKLDQSPGPEAAEMLSAS